MITNMQIKYFIKRMGNDNICFEYKNSYSRFLDLDVHVMSENVIIDRSSMYMTYVYFAAGILNQSLDFVK